MPPSPILSSIKELAQYLGAKLDKVLAAVKGIEPSRPTDMRPVIAAISQLAKVKPPTVQVDVDTSSMEEALNRVAAHVHSFTPPKLDPVEHLLTSISSALAETNRTLAALAPQLKEAVASIKLSSPDTIKLDEMQLRSLRSNSARMPTQGGLMTATRISNTTVAAASTSVEYSYKFPSGTVGWLIKLRDQGTLAYYSWTTGKLPSSGDGSTYLTIPQNFLRSQQGVDYSDKTIYLGVETANQTFEIEVFRL